MPIEVTPFGGLGKGKNPPTGQIIMRLTMDTDGRIEEGACLDGPNYTGIVLIECPISATETRLSLQHKKKFPPFWWGAKHQRAADMWLADKRMKIQIAHKNRQKKIQPSGLREDL